MWITDGDRNTSFFHQKASNQKDRNSIRGICDATRQWQEDDHTTENIILDYFETIFRSNGPIDTLVLVDAVQPVVTDEMNTFLTRVFTAEEVHKALKQMHPKKSSGLDGMPPLFYQHFWSLTSECVTKTILDFLNMGIIPPNFNETHIVLIPKTKNPTNMTQYRPISLCNVISRLTSKVIANRLKRFLPRIVSENQSAFISDCLITDNNIVAFETMHHLNQKRSGKIGEMALKLDMSKAFDCVEWGCLEKNMHKMGFNDKWVKLIMQCITSVTYSVRINGKPQGHIILSRGLRQGDPISLFLFLLCAVGLSALLNRSAATRQLRGVSACPLGPRISHLFFADDSIIFCQATLEQCSHLEHILTIYEQASGQQLNKEKIALFFSRITPRDTQEEIKICFRAEVIRQHKTYLGLPSLVCR